MSTFANIVIKSLPESELKALHPQFETRQIISQVLQITNNDSWEIVDSIEEKSLYMVHYTDVADLSIYGQFRGTIVDTKANAVIRKGIGYTPTITTDQL